MSFKQQHINEDLNFNEVQVPQENVLTSYYYDKLLSIFNQHYFRCDLAICTSNSQKPMIILKNKISGTENYETLLYLIPKVINGVSGFNLKLLRYKSFTTKQRYIDVAEIVKMIVDLSSAIKIHRCLMHLPGNEAPCFDFYLTGYNLSWENIKFLIRNKIKIVFDNYVFCINDDNLKRYGEVNQKHYQNYSEQSKQDSILTDLGNVFYPLIGDINHSGSKVLNRTKLDESVDFDGIVDDTSDKLSQNFYNILIQNICKKYVKDDNLFVASNENRLFLKTVWDGNVVTLAYIPTTTSTTKEIMFTKHYAEMFNRQQNGDPEAKKAYEFDTTSTLFLVYDLMKQLGKGSIKSIKIKVPADTHSNIRFGEISIPQLGSKFYELFVGNDVKLVDIVTNSPSPTYGGFKHFRINIDGLYPTYPKDIRRELVHTLLMNQAPFEVNHAPLMYALNENLDFNSVKNDDELLKPEQVILETLKVKMPKGHKDDVSIHVIDFDDVKQYRILINKEYLARLVVDTTNSIQARLQINWNFSIPNSKIWDYKITNIFNFLLSIPIDFKYVRFEGKSQLPIHLDLNILNINRLIENNISVDWKPGFDLHNVDKFMEKQNIDMMQTMKLLTKIFNSYKFNDDNRTLA